MKTRSLLALLFTGIGVLSFVSLISCERITEMKFNHSLIPGTYLSYAIITFERNDSTIRDHIPESWEADGTTFPVEIVSTGYKTYSLFFKHTDTRLPEQITIEFYDYVEQKDPSGMTASIRLTETSGYRMGTTGNSISLVYFYGMIYYDVSIINTDTNEKFRFHGERSY